jgi:hypothetical protein
MTVDQEREVQVAIVASETALAHLQQARELLDKARSWGTFDIVAGGLLSTMVKHSRMNEAQRELNEAKKALQVFSSQLRALDYAREITLDTGDFLGVADYIFDSLITDFMMQSRIREAQEKLDQTILQVLQMREDLEAILKER